MSNKYADISKVKITTLNKNGKTILDDVYFTSYAMIQLKQNQNANELLKSYVNKNKNANQNVFLLFAKSLFQNNQAIR